MCSTNTCGGSITWSSTETSLVSAGSTTRRLPPEDQPARGYAGAGGDEDMLDVVDLVARRAPDLADGFGDAVHPVDVRLAEQSAARVDRQLASERQAFDRCPLLRLAPGAEAQLLQLHEHERREVVVQERGGDVGGREPGGAPEARADNAHLGQAGEVVAVVARHRLAVERRALRGRGDDGRRLPEIARALGRRHDEGHAAVALLAAVEEPQHGFDDP